jgi:AraC-like DNA-binding protein
MCYICGIDTHHTEAIVTGSFSHFGVSFFPQGLAAFFRENPSGLVNTAPEIQMVCQAQLHEKLDGAKNHVERVRIVTKYLSEKLIMSQQDLIINDLIVTHGADYKISTDSLRKKYEVSERCLQRRFKAAVGISHKKYQRILRFEKSLKLLMDASYNELTAIAYELRFTDQSHFIKDFTAFAGMSPYAFARHKIVGSESSSFIYTK